VKQGIRSFEEVGRPLRQNRTYTLVVDDSWLDATGAQLVAPFRREIHVGPAITHALDPTSWRLQAPAEGRRDPLIVSFPASIDYALSLDAFIVVNARGERLDGDSSIDAAETRWRFLPREPWRAGEYRLAALPILEDSA